MTTLKFLIFFFHFINFYQLLQLENQFSVELFSSKQSSLIQVYFNRVTLSHKSLAKSIHTSELQF